MRIEYNRKICLHGSVTSCYGNRNNCTINIFIEKDIPLSSRSSIQLKTRIRRGGSWVWVESSLLSPHVSIHLIERVNEIHGEYLSKYYNHSVLLVFSVVYY